jgi:hypothetical protein
MTRLFHTVRFHSRSRSTKQSYQILAVEKSECNEYSGSEVIRLSNIQSTPAGNCSMAVQIYGMTLSWMLVLPVVSKQSAYNGIYLASLSHLIS